jgi:hypothetical protein
MLMEFECLLKIGKNIENWKGKITYYNIEDDILEMYVESRSYIHIILGRTQYGNFVCIPNYDSGCYLSTLSDFFWNSEKLSKLIGKVDGITVATAIKYIQSELLLEDYY